MYHDYIDESLTMTFKPLSEHEALTEGLLAEGEGAFEVTKAFIAMSKSGSGLPVLYITLKAWDCNGKEGFIRLYLTDVAGFRKHLRNFLLSIDCTDLYDSGTLNNETCRKRIVGKMANLKIGIKIDKSGTYAPQNIASAFFKKANDLTMGMPAAAEFNDTVPF